MSQNQPPLGPPRRPISAVALNEKWDHCIENFIRKTTIGVSVGILPALLLARSLAARASIVALFTGIGSGIAYGEARYLFDHDVFFDRRHLVHREILTSK